MARSFTITAAKETCGLDSARKGEASFTVTNTASRPVRGQLKVKPLGSMQPAWLALSGDAERDFRPAETQQVSVKVLVPPQAPSGKYTFRLDAVSVSEPDDDFAEGPAVAVDVPAVVTDGGRKFPWWIVAVAVVVLLILGGVAFWLMNPGDVQVANVVGEPYDKAKSALEAQGFKVARQDEPSDSPVGQVVRQVPAARSDAKKDSTVQLFVSTPQDIAIERVVGQPFDKAKAALEGLGFTVTRKDEPNNSRPAGEVLAQDPATGSAPKGSPVQLTVAARNVAEMPNVVRLPEAQAREELAKRGFKTIGVTRQPKLAADFPAGTVASQSPAARASVTPETAVALVIADEGVRVPRVPASQAAAGRTLAQHGLRATGVRGNGRTTRPITDLSPVTGTQPTEGTLVAKGSEVALIVDGPPSRVLIPFDRVFRADKIGPVGPK